MTYRMKDKTVNNYLRRSIVECSKAITVLSKEVQGKEKKSSAMVLALARLTAALSKLIERSGNQEKDPYRYGDPGYHARLLGDE